MKNYEKVVEILEKHLNDESIFYGEIAFEICDLFAVIKCDCEDSNYALVEITENLCLECNKPIK